ncbi:MAG: hypothetical protein ABW133_16230, partial [Polyangiaceae bacterium]
MSSKGAWGVTVAMCTALVPSCRKPHAENAVVALQDAAEVEAAGSAEPVVELPPAPEIAAAAAPPAPPPPGSEAGSCPVDSDEGMGIFVSPIRPYVGSP